MKPSVSAEPAQPIWESQPRAGFDPRAKLWAYLWVSLLALLAARPLQLAGILAPLLALIIALRVLRRWLRLLRALLPTLLLFAAAAWLGDGPAAALGATLRLLALVSAGVLLFATTPPEQIGDALLASGAPSQAAFLLEGTLRFVPTMGRLLREVRDAQAGRGMRFDGLHMLRNGPALLAPLLVSALRFADSLAEALEARGFGSLQRTPLGSYRFRLRDWLLAIGCGAVGGSVCAYLLVLR